MALFTKAAAVAFTGLVPADEVVLNLKQPVQSPGQSNMRFAKATRTFRGASAAITVNSSASLTKHIKAFICISRND